MDSIAGDSLQAGSRCHPGRGPGWATIHPQFTAITAGTRATSPGCSVDRKPSRVTSSAPVNTSRISSLVGRCATPRRPGGTLSCQAHKDSPSRDGLT